MATSDWTAQLSEMGYQKTGHFQCRQVQRSIQDPVVILALRFGRRFYEKGGDRVFFLGRKQIPTGTAPQIAERANGTAVIVGADGSLITTFRNRDFSRTLRRRQ